MSISKEKKHESTYELSKREWAQTENRMQEVKEGKAKLVPAREAALRIQNALYAGIGLGCDALRSYK